MLLKLIYYTFAIWLSLVSCTSIQKTTSRGTQDGKYSEDLSGVRPKAEAIPESDSTKKQSVKRDAKSYVEPKYTVNKQLDAVLDSIDRINLNRRFIDGFTIQVYSGLNREEAMLVKRDLTTYLPKLEADVLYNQPNFRVKTGRYFNQLEAQKDFQLIKTIFPNAIIVPDKISIK